MWREGMRGTSLAVAQKGRDNALLGVRKAMTALKSPARPSGAAQVSAALGSGGALAFGAVWYAVLMRPVWAASSLGPICGHQGALLLHCPACYAAMTLMAAGVAGLGLSFNPAPAPIRLKA